MKLNDKDKKLIVLAMDAGAADGEITNAALALFRRWRALFKDGYELVKNIDGATAQPKQKREDRPSQRDACGRLVLRFGKYKGRTIRDIPIDYLFWVIKNCTRLNRQTRKAINIYLGNDSD